MISTHATAGPPKLERVRITATETPRVTARLRWSHPLAGATSFAPLRLPDRAQLDLGAPLRALLHTNGVATGWLREGHHELSLGEGLAIRVAVAEQAKATLSWSVGEGHSGRCTFRDAALEFDPPLRAENPLGLLLDSGSRLPQVWLDRFRRLRDRAPETALTALALARSRADANVAFEIRRLEVGLDEATGRLVIRVSGAVDLLEQLSIPFDKVAVPQTLLPELYPEVKELAPHVVRLVQAIRGSEVTCAVLRQLVELIERVEAPLEVRLTAPELCLRSSSADGTRAALDLGFEQAIGLRGRLEATRNADTVRFQCSEMALQFGQTTVSADLRGELPVPAAMEEPGTSVGTRPTPSVNATLAFDGDVPITDASFRRVHPLCAGDQLIELKLERLGLKGALDLTFAQGRAAMTVGSSLNIEADVGEGSSVRIPLGATGRLTSGLRGSIKARCDATDSSRLRVESSVRAELNNTLKAELDPIVEIDLKDGELTGNVSSQLDLNVQAVVRRIRQSDWRVDLEGTHAAVVVRQGRFDLDRRRIVLPEGMAISARLQSGSLTSWGLEPCDAQVGWDLHQLPCLLHFDDPATDRHRSVSVLSSPLRQGSLMMHLTANGRLSFSGDREGLYGDRYFNALLNPTADLGEWYRILTSDDAFQRLAAGLEVFSSELVDMLSGLRLMLISARDVFRRERIRKIGDLLPRPIMARVLSLLLVGTPRLTDELIPIIEQVTQAKGLALSKVKLLLAREFGDLLPDYEVGAILNWANLILLPGTPLGVPQAEYEAPLLLDAAHREALADLPSADEIYRLARGELDDDDAVGRVCELAPELTEEQLDYVLAQSHTRTWGDAALNRLRYVLQLKRRIKQVAEHYGGIEHAVQPFVIGSFIGDAVGGLPGITGATVDRTAMTRWCSLGAADIATLLQAGLAMARHGRRTQLNNRLLLELLGSREPELTRNVLIELGHLSPRALTGILYALLEQGQDQLATPLDMAAFLTERLGMEVPRQADFLAGGRRARDSYYGCLSALADRLITAADPYLLRKQHLQRSRRPTSPPLVLKDKAQQLEKCALEQVAAADGLGRTALQKGRVLQARQAVAAYEQAFTRCAELLRQEPRAFQLAGFKQFWRRNEEALRVLSVVRAYQQDLDRVRRWLEVRSGRKDFGGEQQLLEAVVHSLYYRPQDQQQLLADPLVRLLIEPKSAHYDFTIISCMGVITGGADGSELCSAYERLTERHGVRVVRAHTGTGRSLEYNAERIIEAIESCKTPWGIVGYSQGCANALLAETLLHTGTPDQQQSLDRFVCRNQLFSSANGSAHGTTGMAKFVAAMVAGERILKHYQATYSWEATRAVLGTVRALLDAPFFVSTLGGTHSLSYERARGLHRDAQFVDGVPTSPTRTVASPDRIPETLDYTYAVLDHLSGGAEQDTQVVLTDAVGSATRVRNEWTETLERCDMGALPQATHHWAPLSVAEVGIVTTERDRALVIYDTPTDQLVWPWVQVNARFGRISKS